MSATETTAAENGTAPQVDALPIGTVDDILANAFDLTEETIQVPEWGCSVKIRTPNANQASQLKGAAVTFGRGQVEMDLAAMEIEQFRVGVIEPKFTKPQVLQLRQKSGPGFARVIAALDRLGGGNDKEALREAQREFQGADE